MILMHHWFLSQYRPIIFSSYPPTHNPTNSSLRIPSVYSVSQKKSPEFFWNFFPERLGIFSPNFAHLLYDPIYARPHYLQLRQIVVLLLLIIYICRFSLSVPALGMFEVFGQRGPQILGGRNFGP